MFADLNSPSGHRRWLGRVVWAVQLTVVCAGVAAGGDRQAAALERVALCSWERIGSSEV